MRGYTVLAEVASNFSNMTRSAVEFTRDTFSLDLSSSTDYIYVGFSKPFSRIDVELETPASAGEFTAEYSKQGGFSAVDASYFDDTLGFSRSGFISIDRDQKEWVLTEVNGISKYWVRLRPKLSMAGVVVKGLNLLFCNDHDLLGINDQLTNDFSGKTSYIASRVYAKNHIVTLLRDSGAKKSDGSKWKNINEFDVLNPEALKLASAYYALANLYENISDDPESTEMLQAIKYNRLGNKSFDLSSVNLDFNDDGIESESETKAFSGIPIRRV